MSVIFKDDKGQYKVPFLSDLAGGGVNLVGGTLLNTDFTKREGNSKEFYFSAPSDKNWYYCVFPLNTSFKKGDVFTLSAYTELTGNQVGDGSYKVTIFNHDTSVCYETENDINFLKAGQRSSKIIRVNADSDPNNPPILLIYSGTAGKTGGNTIHVKDLKLERGSIATAWSPAPEDVVLKSDFDSLKAKIDSLTKSINGGVAAHLQTSYAPLEMEVA